MASFNVSQAENHQHIEIKWVGTGKRVSCHGNSIFIAVGVFSLELLPYQVSMVCDASWPR